MDRKQKGKSSAAAENSDRNAERNLAELFAAHNLLQSNPLALLQQQMNVMAQQAGPAAFFGQNSNPYNNPAATWLYLDYISRIQAAQQMGIPAGNNNNSSSGTSGNSSGNTSNSQQKQQQSQSQQQQSHPQQREDRNSSAGSSAASAAASISASITGSNSHPLTASSLSRPSLKQGRQPPTNKKLKLPADTDIIRMSSTASNQHRSGGGGHPPPPPPIVRAPKVPHPPPPLQSHHSSSVSRTMNKNQPPKESPPNVQLFKIEDLDAPLNLSKKSSNSGPPKSAQPYLVKDREPPSTTKVTHNNNVTIIPHAHSKPVNLSEHPGRYSQDLVPKPAHMSKSTVYSHVIPKVPQVGMITKPNNEKLVKKKTTVASLLAQSRVQQHESSRTSSRSNSPEANNIDIRSSPTSAPHRPWVNNPTPLIIPSVKKSLHHHQQQQLPPPQLQAHKLKHSKREQLQLLQQKEKELHQEMQEKLQHQNRHHTTNSHPIASGHHQLQQHQKRQENQQLQKQQHLQKQQQQQKPSENQNQLQPQNLSESKESEDSSDGAKDNNTSQNNAVSSADLNEPLAKGWKRETFLQGLGLQGLSGEVVYISPTGVKCKQLADIKKILTPGLNIKMFSFSSRLLIGDFVLPTNSKDSPTTVKLSANQLASWLSSEGEENRKEEARQKEERERKKQHSVLIRALELHRRAKRRHKLQNDRKLRKKAEMMEQQSTQPPSSLPLQPLDSNADVDELNSDSVLPQYLRITGLRLSPQGFANLLQIYEFLHTFGETLGFDMDSLPSMSNLQKAFLHVDENEEELLSVMSHLLVCAVEDPGMSNPNKHITAFGQTLKQADITFGSLSEILRLYLEGIAESEPEADTFSEWLNEAPFLALSPTRKSTIVAFICDLLLQNKAVLKHLESSSEAAHTARKERQQNDIKVRRLRMLCARKAVAAASEQQEKLMLESRSNSETPTKVVENDEASKDTRESETNDKDSNENKDESKGENNYENKDEAKDGTEHENHDETKDEIKEENKELSEETKQLKEETEELKEETKELKEENEELKEEIKGLKEEPKELKEEPKELKEEPKERKEEPKELKEEPKDETTEENKDKDAKDAKEGKEKDRETSISPSIPDPAASPATSSTSASKEPVIPLTPLLAVTAAPEEIDSDDQLEESESDADAKLSVEEIRMKMNQLNNVNEKLKRQMIENFKIIRCSSLGQDRWRRRYWNLPNSGGVYVEGGSTNEFPELKVLAEETITNAKNQPPVEEDEMVDEELKTDETPPEKSESTESCCNKVSESNNSEENSTPEKVEETKPIINNNTDDENCAVDDEIKMENGDSEKLNDSSTPVPFEVPPPVIKIFSIAPRTGCSGKVVHLIEPFEEPESDDQLFLNKLKDNIDVWEGWWKFSDELKDEVVDKACMRGIREKFLKLNLEASMIYEAEELDDDDIEEVLSPEQGWDPDLSYKVHLQLLESMETLEERVGSASLQVKGWQLPTRRGDNLSESDIIELVKVRLLDLESAIERRYLKPPLGKPVNEINLSNLTGDDKDGKEQSQAHGSRALTNWRDGVNRATTPGVLSMAIYTLDSSIAWDKSVMKASCQLCKGGDNEDKLLLCDACDRGYHTYCFKPPLEQIPDGDWFCWECINKATGIKGCIVCGKQAGGGKLLACDKCVKAFHLDCLNPPLAKAPRGRWHCPDHRKLSPSRKRKSENDKTADGITKQQKQNNKKAKTEANWCEKLLEELAGHEDAWPFLDPVNTRQFPTYKKVIKNPMDLATIRSRLSTYKSRETFLQDVRLIFDNCETFNEDDSPVGKAGHSLRIFFESKINCKF